MLRSMTGFGAAAGQVEGVEYSVEIRSVNNRYLKTSLRMPDVLAPLEADVERAVRGKLQRGSVNLQVRMKLSEDRAVYRVNSAALGYYLDELRAQEVEANPTIRLDLGSLLQLPGVCEPPPLEDLAETTRDGLLALVDEALEGLVAMRRREGQALQEDLEDHAARIRERLEGIAGRGDEVLRLYHDRLKQRCEDLMKEARLELDSETLAREVAVYAERSDIAEEVSRLRTHLEAFASACGGDECVGRKLDFMAQEMLREANTIGSKASDADIAAEVVEIKTCIDRIKEQAANVE